METDAVTRQIDRDHDACGIFTQVEKSGLATRRPIEAGIEALAAMCHRAGYVAGEGDGCGLMIDTPRALWRTLLAKDGVDASIVDNKGFFVGHFFMHGLEGSNTGIQEVRQIGDQLLLQKVKHELLAHNVQILLVRIGETCQEALGPMARQEATDFVQIAGVVEKASDTALYLAQQAIEEIPGVHVASLNRDTVVYKLVGDAHALYQYYPDLQQEECASTFVLAHTRYSTNTQTSFNRVQPFSLLGHNGEINTIARFHTEAAMIGVDLDSNFSDSQMVDRLLLALVAERGFSLFEAAELLFPPIVNEIKQMPEHLADMYMFYRSLWGPFSQGPAAIMMRHGDEAIFSVDALGLRPLWQVETDDALCFTSEPGIISPNEWVGNPKPLAPGEKIGLAWIPFGSRGVRQLRRYSYQELQAVVYERAAKRFAVAGEHRNLHFAAPGSEDGGVSHPSRDEKDLAIRMAAYGFRGYDLQLLDAEIRLGAEPIQSLGFDSPIAALSSELHSLSDFLQETVAVVTNPAIDREREIEHFSTRTVLGKRPSLMGLYTDAPRVEVQAPILLEELPPEYSVERQDVQAVAQRKGTLLYEDALALLRTSPHGTVEILLQRLPDESIKAAMSRLEVEALGAVQAGANVIVLDDRQQFAHGGYLDPFIALAAVHKALLRPASSQGGEYLRRRASIVVRSGGFRNLHDVVVAMGLGADAVVPYLMWEYAVSLGGIQAVDNLYDALTKGLEKVISTLGIHEFRGYERLFSAVGLEASIADFLGIASFCSSDTVGFSFAQMEETAKKRHEIYKAETPKDVKLPKVRPYFPSVCKSAAGVAEGKIAYDKFLVLLNSLEHNNPISLRHVLDIKEESDEGKQTPMSQVDTTIDGHAYPFVISSMSFGSQGETSFRAYAEAAFRLNIVGLNGEGGEIKDLLGKYPRNRGREIASGRFGVNAEMCNHAYVLEIKIGQGAKPGEGGHLPASKVTAQVAAARNAAQGVDLISPSNNHDIYSIEDLAQVVFELKQVNPTVRVAVKVPVVPNIGVIAVGIAKAGADIVELSGFDGGTGAARSHAIRHVGLPMEIGIKLAHDALCQAGLRDVVEIWADGGMKSGIDVMKAILLGANRVGFATMAIAAIGCTDCRMCKNREICSMFNEEHGECACHHDDKTHNQDKTAVLHDFEASVAHLERFFTHIGEHVRSLTSKLGAARTQDLVGRRDLLVQVLALDTLDLSWLLSVNVAHSGRGTYVHARQTVEAAASTFVSSHAISVATGTEGMAGHRQYEVSSDGPYSGIHAVPRALGTFEGGEYVRNRLAGLEQKSTQTVECNGVAGAGFAAYHMVGMTSIAYGGAQDGVGKTAFGGRIIVLKQRNRHGTMVGGSVGKSLAYGAQRGLVIVQGDADARAGIRLSGADVIIGGEVLGSISEDASMAAATANIKGFGFEYMTAGRAVVLGDPGPWICSGMTGGTVYLRYEPSLGLTERALRRRLAKGAKVVICALDTDGEADVRELLQNYQYELRKGGQISAAKALSPLVAHPEEHFLMVKPDGVIMDQEIYTE